MPSFEDEEEEEDDLDINDTQEDSWNETARKIAATDTRYLGIQDEKNREGIMASLNETKR